jgi:hypothetical protein
VEELPPHHEDKKLAAPEEKRLRAPTFLGKYSKYKWLILLFLLIIALTETFIAANNAVTPEQPIYVPTSSLTPALSISTFHPTPTFTPTSPQPTSPSPPTLTLRPTYEVIIKVSLMVAPTTDSSLTANWEVYTNEEIGVSFKYPPLFGLINKEEELCWGNGSSMREYKNQPCVGIELGTIMANGKIAFLVAQSSLFLEHRPGRGLYWGDLSSALSKNAEINVKNYCTDYNPLRIACSLNVNSNGVSYTKISETVQMRGYPDTKAIYYVILNRDKDFPVIIIRASENGNLSFEESERVFDQLLSTLTFTP